MEVILIKDVENLGYANDIVAVKPGYANNYLIPQGFAKAATASAKKVLAENLRQRATRTPRFWPTLRLWPRPYRISLSRSPSRPRRRRFSVPLRLPIWPRRSLPKA